MTVLDPDEMSQAPPAALVDAAASPSRPDLLTCATTSSGETVETIACGHTTTLPDGSRIALCRVRPSKRCFIPPAQFGLVCEGLVRSGQPTELNFPFLEKLDLKTVLWLAPEMPSDPL